MIGPRTPPRRAHLLRVLLPFTLSMLAVATAMPQDSPSTAQPVLVLASYSTSFHTFPRQISPINDTLQRRGIPYELVTLDFKRFPQGPRRVELDRRAAERIRAHRPFRLVITTDDYALQYILNNRERLVPGTPTVFLGVNDIERAIAQDDDPLTTGVVERSSMAETLALMRQLFPDRERLIAISDATVSGRADLATFQHLTADRPAVDAWSLAEMSHQDLLRRLREADGRNAYLVLSPYTDVTGATRDLETAVAGLRTAAPQSPFFHLWRHGLDDGLIGGVIVSHAAQSEAAMSLAVQILDGTPPDEIPVVRSSPNRLVLNYPELRRLGVPVRRIPVGAQLLDAPPIMQRDTWRRIVVAAAVLATLAIGLAVMSLVFGHYRALFRDSASIMLLVDPVSGRILSANRAAVRFYGYSKRELTSMRAQDLHADDPAAVPEKLAAAAGGERSSFEVRHRCADGSVREVEVFSGPVGYAGGRLYSIIHDVTDRKNAERDLIRTQQEAETANAAKSEFVAHVSHELRTPLSGMLGMATLLDRSPLSEEQRSVLNHLRTAGRDLEEIIDSLLDFSQLSVGTVTVDREPFDLAAELAHTKRYLEELATERGVGLTVGLPTTETWIVTDRGKLNQILVNLVANAIKYSAGGRGDATVSVDLVHDHVTIVVEDTGTGVPEKELPSLFTPFSRGARARASGAPGLGLGLSITRDITDMLGGEIGVMNRPGGGLGITVSVPVEIPPAGTTAEAPATDDQSPVAGAAESSVGDPPEGGPTVLVVEDEWINRHFFATTLRAAGFTVVEAGSIADAVAAVEASRPAMVFMDLGLPDGRGTESVPRIRALGPEFATLPIVALTAYASPEDRRRTEEAGMATHLSKPVMAERLVRTARELTDSRESHGSVHLH